MELTDELAVTLSLGAADHYAKLAGRAAWIQEDVDVAKLVYEKLKPVQKMDEEDQDAH